MHFGVSDQGSNIGSIEQSVGEYLGRRESAGLVRLVISMFLLSGLSNSRQVGNGIGRQCNLLKVAF